MRYLSPLLLSDRVTHERLARMTHNDYDREIALVVEGQENGERAIFGVARLSKLRGTNNEARFTMLISDHFQGQGLGKELLKRVIRVARYEKIQSIIALMAPENAGMRELCLSAGFKFTETVPETNMLKGELAL
jgi:acetyltransferase